MRPIGLTGIFKKNVECFSDNRGMFAVINKTDLTQDCLSISKKNVIRGLHYQWDNPLSKVVTVLHGSILDIIVNINKGSTDFGKYKSFILNPFDTISIPAYYAHGFLSLEDDTMILYNYNTLWNQLGEGVLHPFNSELNIDWGIDKNECILSSRDKNGISWWEYSNNSKFYC